jgi:hypothetical protein
MASHVPLHITAHNTVSEQSECSFVSGYMINEC